MQSLGDERAVGSYPRTWTLSEFLHKTKAKPYKIPARSSHPPTERTASETRPGNETSNLSAHISTRALLILIFFLAGCGSANRGSASLLSAVLPGKGCNTIGVSLPETNTSYRWDNQDRPALLEAIKAALPGVNVLYNNAGGDAAVQQGQVETMMTQGACILVIAPHDSQAAVSIVSEAKTRHVPVIAYDRLISSGDLAAYVSFDGVAIGRLQGEYIAQHYQQYMMLSGANTVAFINGAQTDNNAILLKQGLHEALDSLLNQGALRSVYEQFTDWTAPTAETEIEAALAQTGNRLAVAYVANDDMANSVITALKIQHLDGKVLVTGQDASLAGIQNILTGAQAMTVYKAIKKEAQAAAQIVRTLVEGQPVASATTSVTREPTSDRNIPTIALPPVVVDKSNIQSTILADGFWTKAQICANLPIGTGGIC